MSGIIFQSPWILLALLILPFWKWLFDFADNKRRELLSRFGKSSLPEISIAQSRRDQEKWRILLAILLLIIALARPSAHPHPQSSPEGGRDLIFVLDVSRSMLGTDLHPSRLARAKEDILHCLETLKHDRVGLMIFAGVSSLQSPLTTDADFLKNRLQEVSPDSVARGSTYLQIVLEKTIDLMLTPDRKGYQDLILLTDGEDQGSHPEKTFAALNASQTRLMIVGYGDSQFGSRIPLGEKGSEGFLTDQGQEIWTRLQEESLQALAHSVPKGIYLQAGKSGFNLGKAYQDWSLNAPRSPLNGKPKIVYNEYFAWFLLPALLLLALPLFKSPPKIASLSIFLICGMGTLVVNAAELSSDPIAALQKARTETNDLALRSKQTFQLGLLLAKAQQLQEAAQILQEAEDNAPSPSQQAHILYNRALIEAQQAQKAPQIDAKLAFLEIALTKMKRALLLKPEWKSATEVLEILYEQQTNLLAALEDQQKKQKEVDKEQQDLVKLLKKILKDQQELLKKGSQLLKEKKTPSAPKTEELKIQSKNQEDLHEQTTIAKTTLESLQKMFLEAFKQEVKSPDKVENNTTSEPPFSEPLLHLSKAILSQKKSVENLGPFDLLPVAIKEEHQSIKELLTTIKLLDPSSDPQDQTSEQTEDSEESEMSESKDSNAENSALNMKGTNQTDRVNRTLPKPNFSAEQILQEEQENAAARSKNKPARVEKGEKDW